MSATAQQLKEEGIEKVELSNQEFLDKARDVAKRFARTYKEVSSDDIRSWAQATGLKPAHQNAWGAVFKHPAFEPCGFTTSDWPSTHGRVIRTWRLNPDYY